MDNKKFNEIMHEYAKSEKSSSSKALSKLKREGKRIRKSINKHRGFAFACTAMMAIIVLTLCITLPIVLNKKSSGVDEAPQTTYCAADDLILSFVNSIDDLKNEYGINVLYPSFDENITAVSLITSEKYQGLKGCKINYEYFDDMYLLVDFVAIKSDYVVNTYSQYHDLNQQVEWKDTIVKYDSTYDEEIESFISIAFFTDNKYNYYIRIESDDEISITELLDLMFVK